MTEAMSTARVSPSDDPLADLIDSVRSGNEDAARVLLRAVAPGVLAVVRRVLGHRHPDVEDLAQECLVAFVRALGTFRGDCSVMHYARRIALWRALEDRKRRRALKRAIEFDPGAEVESIPSTGNPHEDILCSRRLELLDELLQELPHPQAEVLVLRHLFDHSVEQIAQATGTPTNTVRSRLRLAKHALRSKILERPHLAELNVEEP
jgi:RNA polymerase sigma-70 factor (ECF subfamily)